MVNLPEWFADISYSWFYEFIKKEVTPMNSPKVFTNSIVFSNNDMVKNVIGGVI